MRHCQYGQSQCIKKTHLILFSTHFLIECLHCGDIGGLLNAEALRSEYRITVLSEKDFGNF